MNDLGGTNMIAWIAAEAEEPEVPKSPPFAKDAKDGPPTILRREEQVAKMELPASGLVAHQFPSRGGKMEESALCPPFAKDAKDEPPAEPSESGECLIPDSLESATEIEDRNFEEERERRIYRGRTVAMLRRYMRYSIETGRLPSMLGGQFFRAKVTTYTVVTFEDRVIFVHDMEKCLGRLDEFSRQLIARHILQEHDRWATAKLLHCNEKTVRRCVPVILDLLSDILVEVGLLQRLESKRENSCQGGESDPIDASDCEEGKYKF